MPRKAKKMKIEPPPKRTMATMEFLAIALTADEMLAVTDQLTQVMDEQEKVELEFEAVKASNKERMAVLQKAIKSHFKMLREKKRYANVDCQFIFDEPDKGKKTLVRLDTGEIVRVLPMQGEDFQDKLPLALEPEKSPAPEANAPAPVNGKDNTDNKNNLRVLPIDAKTAAAGDHEPEPPSVA